MTNHIEDRLRELGIALPQAAAPAANYYPFLIENNQLFVSGQLPMGAGGLEFKGALMGTGDVAEGQKAARLCAINILAQAKAALGDLERIIQCLKVGGFVNAAAGFTDHPQVINGASDLLAEILGDRGRHTRFAVGCSSLPFDASVEVEALFRVT